MPFKHMKGRLISFIGMDGAGKSTLTKLTKNTLEKTGFRASLVYVGRGRNNVLPIQFFGKIYRKTGGVESNIPTTRDKFEKISVIHTLAAPIFALDLLLRYFFIILPEQLKNDFVITDRYSTDILLMNKVPMNLKKFLYWFFPKPNKTFYIYNNISVLHKRKPDHSIKDLERQEKLFAKIIKKTNAVKIKNDKIKDSLKKILSVIWRLE